MKISPTLSLNCLDQYFYLFKTFLELFILNEELDIVDMKIW